MELRKLIETIDRSKFAALTELNDGQVSIPLEDLNMLIEAAGYYHDRRQEEIE